MPLFTTWLTFSAEVSLAFDEDSSFLALLCFLRSALQRSLHVFTSSQHRSHTLRHVNGRLHTSQIFEGRFSFFTPRGILLQSRQPSPTAPELRTHWSPTVSSYFPASLPLQHVTKSSSLTKLSHPTSDEGKQL
ncbi:hypothetical protein M758_5G024400 [Ceratodon purpureus]|nr:hypothetical protein M758_5G024400 [Ceratodon purpureus]